MGISAARFLENLKESEVLSDAELRRVAAMVPADAREEDSKPLAELLVERKTLTAFQAEVLMQEEPGALVVREYLIVERLGRGGMATVFKVKHRQKGQHFAIKVQLPESLTDPESVYRFEREVTASAKLAHPNIVKAYDSFAEHGVRYLVMEFVDGMTLSQIVRKRGTFEPGVALNLILQAAQGLDHAHSRAIIHRDVKPENLLVDTAGALKILDLGLARFEYASNSFDRTSSEDRLTQAGVVLGTIDYIAPEQSNDPRSADARSDIYSLGCTLYFLLTGQPPYPRETTVAVLMAHCNDPPPKIATHRKDVSPQLQALFEKMVDKNPRERFQSMVEVVEAVRDLASRLDDVRNILRFAAAVPGVGPSTESGRAAITTVSRAVGAEPVAVESNWYGPLVGLFGGAILGAILGAIFHYARFPFALDASGAISGQLQAVFPTLKISSFAAFIGLSTVIGSGLGLVWGTLLQR